MRVLIITTMRNEAPFILEWIAYHRLIGVTDFLIFSNDCDDGTDAMLDRLQERGDVTHVRNRSGGKKTVQWRALSKAQRHPLLKAADWVYVTDVDEFLCIHAGDGHLRDLCAASPQAQGFAIPWRMFGNAGVTEFTDVPMTTQFTRSAPEALLWPWRAVQFKSLYRHGPDDLLGIHRPKQHSPGPWVDGNGAPLPQRPGTVIPTQASRYGLAQINHYALGSVESFLVKVDRGKPNHSNDPIDLAYWIDRNFNTVEDTRILRHQRGIADGLADFMADPVLADLHAAGVAWRKARIAALLQESDSFYLYSRILQTGDTQALPETRQRQLFEQLMAIRQATARARRANDQ